MAGKTTPSDRSGAAPTRAAPTRADKLKAALKANITRRKAQAAARSARDDGVGDGPNRNDTGPKG